ncbi:MAG TPA: hypothetical protein VF587_20510 [Solirubrobacteraceae bacterium]
MLAIHSPQGTGKTLFAQKLDADFRRSDQAGNLLTADSNNLWHRITGGVDLSRDLIFDATQRSDVLLIENNREWVTTTAEWIRHRPGRRLVVIADNAERGYFRQGLVDVNDAEFVQLRQGPELTSLAAQRLVEHCRSDFRGALFVVLSNNDEFLLALDEEVAAQHAGLLTLTQLPVPDSRTKETVVRVNTNRLNPVSYWFCVDKGGPQEKVAIKAALDGASNFPDSFGAVDTAVRSRTGRPARQNVITLVVMATLEDAGAADLDSYGQLQRTEASSDWFALHTFTGGWAPREIGEREASLLESEWVFRLAIAGTPFVKSLIEIAQSSGDKDAHVEAASELLDALKIFHGPGTHQQTRDRYRDRFAAAVEGWSESAVDVDSFWSQGMTRAATYEAALGELLPGYNTGSESFLTYRPDFIVAPYRPCSVVEAVADTSEAITAAIKRDAHVFEFTAMATYSDASVRGYMAEKLPNYVAVTQEQ